MRNNIILDVAKQLLLMHINHDDCIIDATMGRGHDTLFLAKHVNKVVSFDIQKEAFESTKALLKINHIKNVELILDSHENILSYVKDFKGVVFNLGYLPKGDKTITTTANIIVQTFQKLLLALPINGFILCVVYVAHESGMDEALAIDHYLKTLDQKLYQVLKVSLPFQDNKPPYMIWINKKDHNQM